jgi:N4-gp56 family major capsid protein
MSMYNEDLKLYRALLNKELQLAVWADIPFFGKGSMLGFIGAKGANYPRSVGITSSMTRSLEPTGKPVEFLSNFMHDGGTSMDVVVKYPLTNAPVIGKNKQLLGNEEKQKIAYKQVRVAEVAHAVLIQDTPMSKAVLQKPEYQKQLMGTKKAELQDYFARWGGFAIYDAFLKGASDNVREYYGLGTVSHPNFMALGSGFATWSDTAATYETNVGTAINGLTDTASDKMSAKALKAIALLAAQRKIKKYNGFYHLVLHSDQVYQLISDSEWVNAQKDAMPRGNDNPLFNNIIGSYAGVMVYEDQNMPGVALSGGKPVYGNTNPLENPIYTTGNYRCGVLFGASAVAFGQSEPLQFKEESYDYERKKSEGAYMICGAERADIYDKDGEFGTANLFKENTSSLIVASYSPSTPLWT